MQNHYRQISSRHLQEWERDWQLVFNPNKCAKIRITNKRNVIQTLYNIHGQTLKETSKARYLGYQKSGIEECHRKYVLVPADKAANNVIVV